MPSCDEVPDLVHEKLGSNPREVTRFGASRVWVGHGKAFKMGPPERAAREAYVLGELAGSLPMLVARLIESGQGWLLMEAVPEAYYPSSTRGRADALADLARLHSLFERGPVLEHPRLNDVTGRDLPERLSLARQHVGHLPRSLRAAVEEPHKLLEFVADDEITLIHGDAWPGNVVLNQSGQRFWLDWEEAGVGRAAADLTTWVDGTPWVPASPTPKEDLLAYVDQRRGIDVTHMRLQLDAMFVLLFLLLDLPALDTLRPDAAKSIIESRAIVAAQLGF